MTARELAEVAVRTCQWVHIFRVQEKRFLEDFDRDRNGEYPWEGKDEVIIREGAWENGYERKSRDME